MKKIFFSALVLVALCIQYAVGKPPKNQYQRLYLPQGKEQQLIKIAKDVSAKLAPDYDISSTIPTIFKLEMDYLPDFRDKKMAAVYFMKDSTDYSSIYVRDDETGEQYKFQRPRGMLHVIVSLDTMEPIGIVDYIGTFFRPNYKEYLKNNPGFNLRDLNPKVELPPIRSINEITKEELERKGIKVYLEDPNKQK